MPKQTSIPKTTQAWRVTVTLVLMSVGVWVLVTHWQVVTNSIQVARGASIPWLLVSLLLMALTFCIAAAIYGVLALHRLHYPQTVLVEVSTAFVNRLLPSGLGGLGLHGVYLYKHKHSVAEATVVVSVNNLLGMTAHLLLLGCVTVFYPAVWRQLFDGKHLVLDWWRLAVVIVAVLAVMALPIVRRRVALFANNLLSSVRKMKLLSLLKALCLAMMLTTMYTCLLLCTARSVGVKLGLLQIFVVFSMGMLAGTATPTPGGLVGAEAGLFAGFVAYGVSSSTAGAAVVLYRLTSYWVPLIPGVVVLAVARRRKVV